MSTNNAAHTPGPWCFEDGVSCVSHKRGDITAYHRAGPLDSHNVRVAQARAAIARATGGAQ